MRWGSLLLACLASSVANAAPPAFGGEEDAAAFVRARFRSLGIPIEGSAQFAAVDLNDDGRKDALVLISSRGLCGTGGCQFYVLENLGDRYRLRGRLATTRAPISILHHKTNGWHDIATTVSDAYEAYEEVVQFDGSRYPGASLRNARRSTFRWPAGETLIEPGGVERSLTRR